MADIFVPIKSEVGIVLSFIDDDVAMQLAGIRGNNTSSKHVTLKLELGPANNQKFQIVLPRNDATDRERIIPAPRRVAAVPDPEGGWEIDFVRLVVERVY